MKNENLERYTFAEVFREVPDCGREDELFRYFEGHLTGEEETAYKTHAADCTHCARRLAELYEEQGIIASELPDADKAKRLLEQNRLELRAALDARSAGRKTQRDPLGRRYRLLTFANASMLILVAVLIYPAYRSFRLEKDVQHLERQLQEERSLATRNTGELQRLKQEKETRAQPLLSETTLYPVRPERASRDVIRIRFDENKRSHNLVFALPPDPLENCTVAIFKNSELLWRQDTTATAPSSLISVQLQSTSLPPGEYLLRVTGIKDRTSTVLSEYKLSVLR